MNIDINQHSLENMESKSPKQKYKQFFPFFFYFSDSFCKFAPAICPQGARKYIEMCRAAGWSTTYQKALLTLCFWSNRNYHNRIGNQEQRRVTPRGVVYTLRSVLRGLTMSSQAHFTGVYILQRGCFSVCLLPRLWQASIDEQADASTHVFYMQLSISYNPSDFGALVRTNRIKRQ